MLLFKTLTITVATVAGLVSASALPALEKRATPQCTSDHFEPITTVGNRAGTPFCESRWGVDYLPITTITTWSDSSYVYGIQVTYSDGKVSPIHGYSASYLNKQSIGVLYASDNFTITDLYQTAGYPYLNALYFATKSGKAMNAGEGVYYFPTEYTQAVGTGILFGISGTVNPSNGYLYSLGFQFLNSEITEIDVSNLRFTNLPVDDEDITPTTIDTASFYNNQSSGTEHWSFKNTASVKTTYTFQLQFTESFQPSESIAVGFMGAVPGVTATSTTEFQWQLQAMESFSVAYEYTNTLEWDQEGDVTSGHGVSCVAAYGRGIGNFPYNSTVTVHLANGETFKFEESGTLHVNDASNCQSECSDNNAH